MKGKIVDYQNITCPNSSDCWENYIKEQVLFNIKYGWVPLGSLTVGGKLGTACQTMVKYEDGGDGG